MLLANLYEMKCKFLNIYVHFRFILIERNVILLIFMKFSSKVILHFFKEYFVVLANSGKCVFRFSASDCNMLEPINNKENKLKFY